MEASGGLFVEIQGVTPFLRIFGPVVIATAKIFFQPGVQDDEDIAAAHLLDFEFGGTAFSIFPRN